MDTKFIMEDKMDKIHIMTIEKWEQVNNEAKRSEWADMIEDCNIVLDAIK